MTVSVNHRGRGYSVVLKDESEKLKSFLDKEKKVGLLIAINYTDLREIWLCSFLAGHKDYYSALLGSLGATYNNCVEKNQLTMLT